MKSFVINEKDNVAVCLEDGSIPAGHKTAITNIKSGEPIIKYGFPIGVASANIKSGEHVHSHNMRSSLSGVSSYEYTPQNVGTETKKPRTFLGYKRKNGRVGVRNEVWIISTVGCISATATELAKRAQKYKTENIDGIYAFTHAYGCSQLGDDMEMTLSALYGLSCNPNAAAVLILGLGCENGNINEWLKRFPDFDADRVKFLNCQDVDDELTVGEKILEKLCALADDDRRTLCDASDLVIGLKCGGSDGFSGITANALLGKFTDALVSEGGSAILTEVPEMFGAEQILMNRAVNKDVFENTVNLINNFKKYFLRYGEPVDENPSPGNKEGGITTLAEKSLGCVQKGGVAPVMDVLAYAEGAKEKGLSLLNAPGNDLVASCALAASGAQIVLFTTGRGTPFACPVPTVKISSNTNLFEKKSAWIDFNAGVLLDGEDADAVADRFYDFVLQIAEGKIKTKSEKLDKSSFAIWKDGVTL